MRGTACPTTRRDIRDGPLQPSMLCLTYILPASLLVHAAVLAINEAVDRGVVAQTMMALRNPSAMLLDLREVLAGAYQEVLHRAKLEKGSNARNRVRRV